VAICPSFCQKTENNHLTQACPKGKACLIGFERFCSFSNIAQESKAALGPLLGASNFGTIIIPSFRNYYSA